MKNKADFVKNKTERIKSYIDKKTKPRGAYFNDTSAGDPSSDKFNTRSDKRSVRVKVRPGGDFSPRRSTSKNDAEAQGLKNTLAIEMLNKQIVDVNKKLDTVQARSIEDRIESCFNSINDKLDIKFDSFEQKIDVKLDSFEQKIDVKLDSFEQKMDTKLGALEQKMDTKIDALEQKMDIKIDALEQKMDIKIDALDQKMDIKFEAVDKRFEAVDKRFEAVDKRFDAVDKRFEDVDRKIDSKFTLKGQFMSAIIVIAGVHIPYLLKFLFDFYK